MRNQRDYKKAVLLCQGFVTCFYLAIGIAVYAMAGQYVASPALGTAGVLLKRIAYGLSLPGLLASGVIYAHLPAKYVSLFSRTIFPTPSACPYSLQRVPPLLVTSC